MITPDPFDVMLCQQRHKALKVDLNTSFKSLQKRLLERYDLIVNCIASNYPDGLYIFWIAKAGEANKQLARVESPNLHYCYCYLLECEAIINQPF